MADPIASDRRKWGLVQQTVQGDQSNASCIFDSGRIVFSAAPIGKGAKPNLKLLSQILRSDEPLPRIAREWLADLFDPDASSDHQIKRLERRRKGAPPAGDTNNWPAAQYALLRMDCGDQADDPRARNGKGDKWEVAVEVAAKRFRISESAVEAAMKSFRAAKDVHDRIR